MLSKDQGKSLTLREMSDLRALIPHKKREIYKPNLKSWISQDGMPQ